MHFFELSFHQVSEKDVNNFQFILIVFNAVLFSLHNKKDFVSLIHIQHI